ncbi:dimethylribityllumazine synthase [Lactarius akahatsu]|uniref:6,7-dimethyl-8-ribityllumazine synthase n=1 Tax=Lactarius akahatsu TaxID=416441 RepID=A0AAD4LSQ3_9AGAM|nr:dimethylribityllumazine synthase [Lactarius akahatsu]
MRPTRGRLLLLNSGNASTNYNRTMGDTVKNFPQFTDKFDGSSLRIAIVHARWNKSVIDALVSGAVAKLKESGVKEQNIVLQPVPGSFELPLACQRVIAGSLVQAGASATDLLGGLGINTPRSATPVAGSAAAATTFPSLTPHNRPFDAVIAIGYICESVSHALMRVQLDSGVPVIFGVLTALTEEQALERAGIGRVNKGHNHGEDWGAAAVEMASRVRRWGEGKF